MEKIYRIGTGESYCKFPEKIRLSFANKEISFREAILLADTLSILFHKKPVEITFVNNREHCGTWGSAYQVENRIRINRHDVGTVLHELAHIFAPEKGHGPAFGRTLDTCCVFYLQYLKVRKVL